MLQYTKAKGISGAGWLGLVTRDCPNLIIPIQTIPAARTPGQNWSWSAYTQIVSSLAYDFLLRQLLIATGIGRNITLTTYSQNLIIQELMHIQIATGASQSETPVGEAQIAESAVVVVPKGTGTAMLFVSTTRDIPIAPILIPDSTSISVRTTIDTAAESKRTVLYLSGYNASTLDFIDISTITKQYEQGSPVCYPELNPLASSILVTGNAAANNFGAYSVVVASLTDDYLIWGGAAFQSFEAYTASSAQFDVSLGAAGSEVAQARFAIASPVGYYTSSHCIFPWPFIAYAGERLSIRVSSVNSGSIPYYSSLYGVKL